LSYPINIGLAVYQGMELRFDRDLDAQTTIHAGYGLNSAYAASVPPQVQDGTLVAGQQFLGLPLHKATLSLERDAQAGLGYNIGFVYEGANNALNRPPFATLNAALTWRSSHFDVTLAGTNLSNVYADRFTRSAAGVAYPGAFGPIPTDAYALQGAAFTLSVTRRY
jgi:hypothetical protein